MFSYTDDAIVTSSPTGRHLSTVIRALPGVPTDLWRKHADQVCQVLNELDRNAKLNYQVSYSLGAGLFQTTVGRVKRDELTGKWPTAAYSLTPVPGTRFMARSLSLHLQQVVRVKRTQPCAYDLADPHGPSFAELIDQWYLAPSHMRTEVEPRNSVETCVLLEQRIAELEKQLDDANARLECDHLVELSDLQLRQVYSMPPGSTMPIESQRVIIKRVE